MTKVEKIRQFIGKNEPTRKELVRFIVCKIQKKCNYKEFDRDYTSKYRGMYGTAIASWSKRGYIKGVDGRFQLTLTGREVKSLYSFNWAVCEGYPKGIEDDRRQLADILIGKTIKDIKILESSEWMTQFGIELCDGSLIYAQSDEEGNDAGVMRWDKHNNSDDNFLMYRF